MKVRVEVKERRGNTYAVCTFKVGADGSLSSLDPVLYTRFNDEAAKERNKRCERWSDEPGVTEVYGKAMPGSRLF